MATFGNTSIANPKSIYGGANMIIGGYFEMGDTSGKATGIVAYMYSDINTDVSKKLKAVIYDSNKNLLVNSQTDELTFSTSGAFNRYFNFTFSNPPTLVSKQNYYVAVWAGNYFWQSGEDLSLYLQDTGGNGGYTEPSTRNYMTSSGSFPATTTIKLSYSGFNPCLYCNYIPLKTHTINQKFIKSFGAESLDLGR